MDTLEISTHFTLFPPYENETFMQKDARDGVLTQFSIFTPKNVIIFFLDFFVVSLINKVQWLLIVIFSYVNITKFRPSRAAYIF